MHRILVLGCSNSRSSLNNQLTKELVGLSGFDSILLKDYRNIPLFSKDLLEEKGFPEEIKKIFELIKSYEILLFVCPEHNGYFSAFLKNIIDWVSLINKNFLEGKDIFLASASKTLKVVRNLESTARSTFLLLKCKSYKFFNFNNYRENIEEDRKKIKFLIGLIRKNL